MKHSSNLASAFAKTATTIALSLFLVTPAFARTIRVSGNGYESGYCSGDQGYFCIQTIKDRSERAGIRAAEWSCQTQNGRSLTYTAYCSTFCSPNMVPPGSSSWVRCDANCSMQCEVN